MLPNQQPDTFICNVCSASSPLPANDMQMGRDGGHCRACGSTVRLRAMIRLLSLGLFGRAMAIDDFPPRPELVGWGLSDWHGYAGRLTSRLGYRNTFFHCEPRVDIVAPPREALGTLDFLIASDVFEHVPPPVSRACEGAHALLKPGGILVFSVPFSIKIDATEEHFPELHDYALVEENGRQWLRNRTRDGREQRFDQLKFHGGDGATLEMRKFELEGLKADLARAGFSVTLHGEDAPEWGVVWTQGWSVPMLARRGG